MTPVVALTIAGSDSGGGAGIQADLKTFAALGVFGTSALTALTAQNTTGVRGVHVAPADVVLAQVEAVLDDMAVAAVKTGMLANAAVVGVVADLAGCGRLPNLVVDPVMVASTGARLLDDEATHLYRRRLFPHATVVTPNLAEAEVLVDREIRTLADQRDAARALADDGPRFVVVKGGHAVADCADEAVDVVVADGEVHELRAPRVVTRNHHGTGCSLAAAIAARLALGDAPLAAIEAAKVFVHAALCGGAAWQLGAGHGPLDHFGWAARRPLAS